MGPEKQDRYVPQYYLRCFVNERKQLYVVDRPRAKFFRVPTNKAAGELYFNLVTIGGVNPFAVEEALSDLEGKIAPVLEKVVSTRSLGDESDRNAIMNLIASVTLRNPQRRYTDRTRVSSELTGESLSISRVALTSEKSVRIRRLRGSRVVVDHRIS